MARLEAIADACTRHAFCHFYRYSSIDAADRQESGQAYHEMRPLYALMRDARADAIRHACTCAGPPRHAENFGPQCRRHDSART